MTIGQVLASPNQLDKGRITTCQDGLEPDLCWDARSVTVVGNQGEPSGKSRFIHPAKLKFTLALCGILATVFGAVIGSAQEPPVCYLSDLEPVQTLSKE